MQGKPLPPTKFLDALKPAPKGRRTTIADAGLRGFAVRVTDSGVKSFSFRYRFEGEQRRVTLGTYPATKLSEAHDAARAVLRALEQGDDPNAAQIVPAQQAPTVRTVREVAENSSSNISARMTGAPRTRWRASSSATCYRGSATAISNRLIRAISRT